MSPRRKIAEGDPIAPVAEVKTAGLHERDVYIAAALSGSQEAWERTLDGEWVLDETEIADRAVRIADAVMERKEFTS